MGCQSFCVFWTTYVPRGGGGGGGGGGLAVLQLNSFKRISPQHSSKNKYFVVYFLAGYTVNSYMHRVGRVLSFFSSRWNWDSPLPSLACGSGGGGVPIPTRGQTPWCSICTYFVRSRNCTSVHQTPLFTFIFRAAVLGQPSSLRPHLSYIATRLPVTPTPHQHFTIFSICCVLLSRPQDIGW